MDSVPRFSDQALLDVDRTPAEQLRDAWRFAQATIDALPAHLCVLDETGLILATNSAWRQFADANQPVARQAQAGGNYLQVCNTATGAAAAEATAVAAAIRRAMRDEQATFAMEYECHSPSEERWFLARVSRFPGAGPVRLVVTHEDITERKRAELAARRLAAIVECSDDAIIGKDLDDIVTSWNPGATAIFGYTAAEMIGTSITRLVPADRQGEEAHLIGQIRRGGSVEHFETVRLTKDGRLIHVAITASPIKDNTGRIVGVSKVARDISERWRAEDAQRASDERYRALFDYAPDGIIVANRHSYYLDVNPSMCRLLGYTRDELIGRHASDIVTAPDLSHIDPALQAIASATYRREWQFRRKDGSMFPAEVIGTVMPDGNLVAMVRDATERNQAVEALRTAEERMRFVLHHADVGIWDMDFATGVMRWSEILEAQYGLPPHTFGGTFDAFIELVHPEDRETVQKTVSAASESGGDFWMLSRAVRPDGSVRWLNVAGRILLDERAQPQRGVGISLDVSERRALEAQYQQAQKMEAIGRLAGGVAHDFNNLLTAILGYCELVLVDEHLTESARADVVEIQKAGIQAAGLTRQLLTFSRKQIVELKRLDVNLIIGDMQQMLGRLIGEDVTIAVSLGADLARVKADRGQLEQVVMNLAVNARDAMPHGGTLGIETRNVVLDEHYATTHFEVTPGAYAAITVSDTGSGMTAEVQSHLFEPFYTTKEIGKGTGLGLATVHSIVKRSGGSIGVYSEVGKGTSFTVYLPKAAGDAVAAPAPSPAGRGHGGETVLLVDDAAGLRELTARLLQRLGYRVLVAANAEEAIALVDQHPTIDVMLTDVVMPGASGPELTRQVIERHRSMKVVYMSGYTEEAIVHHGVLKPGIAFLHKPFTSDSLGRKMRETLDGE